MSTKLFNVELLDKLTRKFESSMNEYKLDQECGSLINLIKELNAVRTRFKTVTPKDMTQSEFDNTRRAYSEYLNSNQLASVVNKYFLDYGFNHIENIPSKESKFFNMDFLNNTNFDSDKDLALIVLGSSVMNKYNKDDLSGLQFINGYPFGTGKYYNFLGIFKSSPKDNKNECDDFYHDLELINKYKAYTWLTDDSVRLNTNICKIVYYLTRYIGNVLFNYFIINCNKQLLPKIYVNDNDETLYIEMFTKCNSQLFIKENNLLCVEDVEDEYKQSAVISKMYHIVNAIITRLALNVNSIGNKYQNFYIKLLSDYADRFVYDWKCIIENDDSRQTELILSYNVNLANKYKESDYDKLCKHLLEFGSNLKEDIKPIFKEMKGLIRERYLNTFDNVIDIINSNTPDKAQSIKEILEEKIDKEKLSGFNNFVNLIKNRFSNETENIKTKENDMETLSLYEKYVLPNKDMVTHFEKLRRLDYILESNNPAREIYHNYLRAHGYNRDLENNIISGSNEYFMHKYVSLIYTELTSFRSKPNTVFANSKFNGYDTILEHIYNEIKKTFLEINGLETFMSEEKFIEIMCMYMNAHETTLKVLAENATKANFKGNRNGFNRMW